MYVSIIVREDASTAVRPLGGVLRVSGSPSDVGVSLPDTNSEVLATPASMGCREKQQKNANKWERGRRRTRKRESKKRERKKERRRVRSADKKMDLQLECNAHRPNRFVRGSSLHGRMKRPAAFRPSAHGEDEDRRGRRRRRMGTL